MIQACRKRKSVRDWMSWHSDCAGARRYWNRDGCCSLPYNSDVGWKCRLRSYSRGGCCRGGHWHSRDGCCATIRGAVLKGELPPGKKIPSVRDLAAEAQVNPNTMQRALTELEREGLLVSGGTSGRSVTEEESVLTGMKEEILRELAKECAEKFMVFGVTPSQAAQLLQELDGKKEYL